MRGRGGAGRELAHGASFAQWVDCSASSGQNVVVQGGRVTVDTLTEHEETEHIDDAEELLVEEVSIDGLCGVY